jgi:hypothetical protein
MRAVRSRVRRLETRTPPKVVPVWDRFASALDDSATQHRIIGDVVSGVCRRLSHTDEDRLIAELERIAGVSIDDVIIPAAGSADAPKF